MRGVASGVAVRPPGRVWVRSSVSRTASSRDWSSSRRSRSRCTFSPSWSTGLQFINPLVAEAGLAQWSVGRHLFENLGRTVNSVPLVSTTYAAVKQVVTSPVDRDSEYESGVLVEYPREGMRMIVTTGIGDNEAEPAAQGVPIEGDEPAGAGD